MSTQAEFAFDLPARPVTREADSAERELFDQAVRVHGPALYRLAHRLTGGRAGAEDLVQETFLKAWRALGRFRGESAIHTWLYRILLNTDRDRRRRPAAFAEAPEPADVPSRDPARTSQRRELVARVLAEIDTLPRRQREAILLRARGGLPLAEIADAMGVKKGVVKVHLARARKKLARRFGRDALGGEG